VKKKGKTKGEGQQLGEMFVIIIVIGFYCLHRDAFDNSMSFSILN
jgi:hypothetical protein